MNRLLVFVVAAAIFFGVALSRANAMSEICPAELDIVPVHTANAKTLQSDLFGIKLGAPSARTIRGRLAFYTDAGWFWISLPATRLSARSRRMHGPSADITVSEAEAPALFVSFAAPVTVKYAFLADAVTDASTWSANRKVTCYNGVAPIAKTYRNEYDYFQEVSPENAWENGPSATDIVLTAQGGAALGDTSCAKPFQDAIATRPDIERPPEGDWGYTDYANEIRVILDETGVARETEVYYSSGYDVFDLESLREASLTTYRPAISFCKPVTSEYIMSYRYSYNT